MEKLAPFADDMSLAWNLKANAFVQAVSIGYGASLVVSLVFQNTLQCRAEPRIVPLTYVIYATDAVCVLARAYLAGAAFRSFNAMQLLFAIVLSFVCLVLTVIVMVLSPPWVDVVLGVAFIVALAFHFYMLWRVFQRLTKMG